MRDTAIVRQTSSLRNHIDAEARFLKKYVPGFDKASIGSVGRYVGNAINASGK